MIMISTLLSQSPELFQLSYFDRELISEGQFWRLVSGHFSHTSLSHLGWDLLAFSLAAGYLERHSRKLLFISLAAAIVTVDALLLSDWAMITRYAGLSGILFSPLIFSLVIFALKQPSATGWLPLAICLIKLIWEQFSQVTLFSQSPWPAYPAAHLAGTVGALVCLAILISFPRLLSGGKFTKQIVTIDKS
ncbi:hypothetical protein GCM10007941_17030 [Amphritea balenae]|nr:hypothetical protein GCM10007941_17030 [Amphritea balenae]